jgi:hypothetical protein
MTFCNLFAFKLFWIPAERRVAARSVSVTRHFKVPPGAVLVGVYAHGKDIRTLDVLEDLLETLERTPAPPVTPQRPPQLRTRQKAPSGPKPEPQARARGPRWDHAWIFSKSK